MPVQERAAGAISDSITDMECGSSVMPRWASTKIMESLESAGIAIVDAKLRRACVEAVRAIAWADSMAEINTWVTWNFPEGYRRHHYLQYTGAAEAELALRRAIQLLTKDSGK